MDVTGLLIGVVALASLFSTCIELFDRFEAGRNYTSDYQLACSKLELLKLRLRRWGDSLSVQRPGREHIGLRRHWHEERDAVARALFGMTELFEKASVLSKKHELTIRHLPEISASAASSSNHNSQLVLSADKKRAVRGWKLLRKKATWAIHDKEKFDALIDSLAFFVEQLEAVAISVMNESRANANTTSRRTPPAVIEPRQQSGEMSKAKGDDETAGRHSSTLDIDKISSEFDGDFFRADQKVNGPGFIGNIGDKATKGQKNVYDVRQTTQGFGGIGTISDTAFEKLLQQQEKNSKNGA